MKNPLVRLALFLLCLECQFLGFSVVAGIVFLFGAPVITCVVAGVCFVIGIFCMKPPTKNLCIPNVVAVVLLGIVEYTHMHDLMMINGLYMSLGGISLIAIIYTRPDVYIEMRREIENSLKYSGMAGETMC